MTTATATLRTSRARTVRQLTDAASQGSQFTCGTIADHCGNEKVYCPSCRDLRDRMSAAYQEGLNDGKDHNPRLDRNQLEITKKRVQEAYDLTNTEPALSYIVGYYSSLPAN